MTSGADTAPDNVVNILTRQTTRMFYLYCYQCGLQSKSKQCVTMRPKQLTYPGCLKAGFLLWQSGQR